MPSLPESARQEMAIFVITGQMDPSVAMPQNDTDIATKREYQMSLHCEKSGRSRPFGRQIGFFNTKTAPTGLFVLGSGLESAAVEERRIQWWVLGFGRPSRGWEKPGSCTGREAVLVPRSRSSGGWASWRETLHPSVGGEWIRPWTEGYLRRYLLIRVETHLIQRFGICGPRTSFLLHVAHRPAGPAGRVHAGCVALLDATPAAPSSQFIREREKSQFYLRKNDRLGCFENAGVMTARTQLWDGLSLRHRVVTSASQQRRRRDAFWRLHGFNRRRIQCKPGPTRLTVIQTASMAVCLEILPRKRTLTPTDARRRNSSTFAAENVTKPQMSKSSTQANKLVGVQ